MASYLIRRRWFGWPLPAHAGAPVLEEPKAKVGTAQVVLYFDEPLRAGPAIGQFGVNVAGSGRAVSAAVVSGSKLTLTFAAPNLTAGQKVIVSYTKGGTAGTRLADTGGTEVANFNTTVSAS